MQQPAVVIAAANGQKEVLEFLLDHYQNLCSPKDAARVRICVLVQSLA